MLLNRRSLGRSKTISLAILCVLVASGLLGFSGGAKASHASNVTLQTLTFEGKTTLSSGPSVTGSLSWSAVIHWIQLEESVLGKGIASSHQLAGLVPPAAGGSIAEGSSTGFFGFNGLSGFDSAVANGFNVEPPDQALCAGNGFVVEGVNLVLAVFDTSGHRLTAPESLYTFFHTSTLDFPIGDVKCYFDASTGHWFITQLDFQRNPGGGLTGQSRVQIAVSGGSDPRGQFFLYSINTTDDGSGGTPHHPGCPCFGDQPLIGTDANGFYVSTNEFGIFAPFFNGPQIYAMSKAALISGVLPTVVHIAVAPTLLPFGGSTFSIQPATVPPGGTFALNTEYFLSTAFTVTSDNRIALWALFGTNTLAQSTPSVTLDFVVLTSEVYGLPVAAAQKPGPTPLAQNCTALERLGQEVCPQSEGFLDGGDTRANQVVFANGMLWMGLNTVIVPPSGPPRDGIAFFIIHPTGVNVVSGTIVKQGYVTVAGNNVIYPSIGVNAAGKGVMGFTLVGPDFFPSVAFVRIDATHGAGAVQVAGAGNAPDDGFTIYLPGFNHTGRWGDYSAGTAVSGGSIWIAGEYIPNAPRTTFTNWGTFVANVVP